MNNSHSMVVVKNIGTFPENMNAIEAIARQSAKYLLDLFEKDGTDVFLMVFMMAKLCMERNMMMVYLKILRYCRHNNHELPEHYNDVAASEEAFAFYSKQLLYYLVDLWGDRIR